MDDDWLCADEEIDPRQLEQRNTATELTKIAEQERNQGYLAGLDWADDNWKSIDGLQQFQEAFRQGYELGAEAALGREFKYTSVGKLNYKLLITGNDAIRSVLKELDQCDSDSEISQSLKDQINVLLNQ